MDNEDFFKKQTPSSRIKANIVAEYFPQYCKILNKRKQERIAYVDLYSGPGKYEDGNLSTPLLIAKACCDDPELKNLVHLLFNDNTYIDKLKLNFEDTFPAGSFKFDPRFASKTVGDDDQITKYLMQDRTGKKNKIPTLLFVDPFGYKSINTESLANFMNGWGNEIFLFLNIKRVQAALDNDKFDELMLCLFPSTVDALRKDRKYLASVSERLTLIVNNLFDEFKCRTTGTLFHCRFKFKEEDSVGTSHYILHFTKHARGYELIKQIYNEFDNIGASLEKDGSYTFDAKKLDADPTKMTIDFGDINVHALSKLLVEEYAGKTVIAVDLFDKHQVKTMFAARHYRDTLRQMVKEGKIIARHTDDKNHRHEVLINNTCELTFM